MLRWTGLELQILGPDRAAVRVANVFSDHGDELVPVVGLDGERAVRRGALEVGGLWVHPPGCVNSLHGDKRLACIANRLSFDGANRAVRTSSQAQRRFKFEIHSSNFPNRRS